MTMQNFHNPQLENFIYIMIYKDWCFKQLILSFDHTNDIILLLRKKIYDILKIRTFHAPSASELMNNIQIYNTIDCVFIDTNGIIFKSYCIENVKNTISRLVNLRSIHISKYDHNQQCARIAYFYNIKHNGIIVFTVIFDQSYIKYDTITLDNEKILYNKVIFDKNPTFTVS